MKDYRKNELKWLSILYIVTFVMLCTKTYEKLLICTSKENIKIIASLIEGVVLSCTVPLLAFIFDCIISSNIKNKLFSLFLIPMSGETVFSKIKVGKFKDKRIDESELNTTFEDILNKLPNSKGKKRLYENREWYKIYNKHRTDSAITQLQKDYLTCRDMFVHTVFCFIFYIILTIVSSHISFSWAFTCLLIFFATITNISCHTKMKRFVYTVIIQEALSQQYNVKTHVF